MIVIKRVKKDEHIPVDQWDTEANPISDQDRIFRNIKGEIILPIAEFFCDGREESKQLDYFIMNSKRSYNSDEIRMHICGADSHSARKNARETGILEEILLKNNSSFDYMLIKK